MYRLGLDTTVSNYYNQGMFKHPSKMNKEGESYYKWEAGLG